MNASLAINSPLFSFNSPQVGANLLNANPLITIATMNRAEITVHTEACQEKYRVEEKDGSIFIYKYQRGFLGFHYFKKLAQARCREGALKIIHILTAGNILHWEVSPVAYFESHAF